MSQLEYAHRSVSPTANSLPEVRAVPVPEAAGRRSAEGVDGIQVGIVQGHVLSDPAEQNGKTKSRYAEHHQRQHAGASSDRLPRATGTRTGERMAEQATPGRVAHATTLPGVHPRSRGSHGGAPPLACTVVAGCAE